MGFFQNKTANATTAKPAVKKAPSSNAEFAGAGKTYAKNRHLYEALGEYVLTITEYKRVNKYSIFSVKVDEMVTGSDAKVGETLTHAINRNSDYPDAMWKDMKAILYAALGIDANDDEAWAAADEAVASYDGDFAAELDGYGTFCGDTFVGNKVVCQVRTTKKKDGTPIQRPFFAPYVDGAGPYGKAA